MEPNEDVIRSCNYFNNPIPPVGSYTNQEVGAMIAYGPLDYDYQEFKDIEELDVMVGESSYADITIKGISKATGIAYFMKLWNMKSYVAFGDSLNDVEMFKHASFSICMGQGNNELKKLSDFVTTSIDEDGIYYACKELGYI
jgi:hydroxymethylpyrimidine pyrophosphatase-like HAD family hydrolase